MEGGLAESLGAPAGVKSLDVVDELAALGGVAGLDELGLAPGARAIEGTLDGRAAACALGAEPAAELGEARGEIGEAALRAGPRLSISPSPSSPPRQRARTRARNALLASGHYP